MLPKLLLGLSLPQVQGFHQSDFFHWNNVKLWTSAASLKMELELI